MKGLLTFEGINQISYQLHPQSHCQYFPHLLFSYYSWFSVGFEKCRVGKEEAEQKCKSVLVFAGG